MALLTELLRFVVANLGTLLGLTQGVSKQVAHTAQETTPNLIQDNTHNTITDLENIVYGLFALHNQLTAIKAVVDTLQVAGSPVTLPATPPSGYGTAGIAASIPALVWAYDFEGFGFTCGEELAWAGAYAGLQNILQSFGGSPYWIPFGWPQGYNQYGDVVWPVFDLGSLLPTDTLLAFLTRLNPGATVFENEGLGGHVIVELAISDAYRNWQTAIDEAGFHQIVEAVFPVANLSESPIWPGLAFVTLGTPVAITGDDTISLPMDGVLIALTSVPARLSVYPYGSLNSYKAIGGLVFLSDNGDAEPFQTLGFTAAVYSPKILVQAAGVTVRASSGVVGTITPWTRL